MLRTGDFGQGRAAADLGAGVVDVQRQVRGDLEQTCSCVRSLTSYTPLPRARCRPHLAPLGGVALELPGERWGGG